MKNSILFVALLFMVLSVSASDTLRVDVHEFRPMVYKEGTHFRGFDIELWEAIADELEVPYKLNMVDKFDRLFANLMCDSSDVAIAGISITSNRENFCDFSGYFNSGLSILILKKSSETIKSQLLFFIGVMKKIFPILVGFIIYALFVGLIMWACELGNSMFDDDIRKGWFDGFYWVMVVVTTVGFGDKVPLSNKGRLLTIVLMWSGIFIMVPLVTGTVTSEMTNKKATYAINGKEDLKGKRVAVRSGTTSHDAVVNLGAIAVTTETLRISVTMLREGKVDAMVHDIPALNNIAREVSDLVVVRDLFNKQDYGVAVKDGSPLREGINKAILKLKEDGTYDRIYKRYFRD